MSVELPLLLASMAAANHLQTLILVARAFIHSQLTALRCTAHTQQSMRLYNRL